MEKENRKRKKKEVPSARIAPARNTKRKEASLEIKEETANRRNQPEGVLMGRPTTGKSLAKWWYESGDAEQFPPEPTDVAACT